MLSALALAALFAAPASADVTLSMSNGRVSISARDATVRQILAEWSRVGQTKIVNAERIAGAPLTIELQNVPESQALEILLRSVSGYVAAPRAEMIANASQFDRIVVMPTSSPARPVAPAPASPAMPGYRPQPQFGPGGSPQFPQPAMPPPIEDEDRDTDEPPAPAVPPNAAPRGPVFNTFGAPPQAAPQQAPQGTPQQPYVAPVPGTAPVGVATPGMVVPAPAQPNQPGVPPQQPGTRTPDGRVID